MIREVHKITSDWNNWYDEYVVYYVSGRRRAYYVHNAPKSVKNFVSDDKTEFIVVPGGCVRYIRQS